MILGVDLSNNQAGAVRSFERMAASGVKFVYLKVDEGVNFTDRYYQDWRRQARAAGIYVGGYHFARDDRNPPETEARHFADRLGRLDRRDLRPCLDFETGHPDAGWADRFCRTVHKLTGVGPIFYSYPSFIQQMEARKPVGNGLWLASYSRNDGHEHDYSVPRPWRRTVAHQFTSNGTIPGVSGRVDLSHARRLFPLLARRG